MFILYMQLIQSILILNLIISFTLIQSKYSIPRIPLATIVNINLMLGQSYKYQQPNLQNIYDIQIQQKVIYRQKQSQLCKVSKSEIKLREMSILRFTQNTTIIDESSYIKSMDDLQHMKNVLDIVFFKNRYYVAFAEGNIEVYDIKNEHINLIKTITSDKLSEGQFIKNQNILLYISNQQIIQIAEDKIIQVQSYLPNQYFQTAKLSNNNTLFIASGIKGVFVYKYSNYTLSNQFLIDSLKIFNDSKDNRKMQISNILYDDSIKMLFIVDRISGVIFTNFDQINQQLKINNSYSLQEQQCENIKFYNNTIYVTCPQLIRYGLTQKIKQKKSQAIRIYPQNIQIVFSYPKYHPIIFLLGDSHIGYYQQWDSQIIYMELLEPQNIIYQYPFLIYVNSYQIIYGKIQSKTQQLLCVGNKDEQLGNHLIKLYVKSDCNNSYLKQNNVFQNINQKNICIYQNSLNFKVSKQKNYIWLIVLIVLGVIEIILIGGAAFWYINMKNNLKRQYHQLNQLTTQNQVQAHSEVTKQVNLQAN